MYGRSLKRASLMGARPIIHMLRVAFSGCLAVFVPATIIVLGLIIQLLVSKSSDQVPNDLILGPIWGWLTSWMEPQSCLLVLLACGGLFAACSAVSQIALQRIVQVAAVDSTLAIMRAVHAQTFQLGAGDVLGQRWRPERLFCENANTIQSALVRWWRAVPGSGILVVALVCMALVTNLWLSAAAISLTVAVWRGFVQLRQAADKVSQHWLEQVDGNHAALVEDLRLATTATGFSLAEVPGAPFEEGLQTYRKSALKSRLSGATLTPMLLLVVQLGVGFLLLVVGVSSELTLTGTVVIAASLIAAYFPAARLYRLRRGLKDVETEADELFLYLDRKPRVIQRDDAEPLERIKLNIELDNVTLANRNGHRLLDGVTLDIQAHRRLAFISSDVSTPLALAALLVRYHDPVAGRILFDGQDIQHATLDTVRGQGVLVANPGLVFTGTVAENIACGDTGFTSLQINDAAKRSRAHEFIQSLPLQFDTVIGERGVKLSDDQAFRIGLARALLREPSLLILEEPRGEDTAESAHQEIGQAIDSAAKGRTLILLPSRLSSLRNCDEVYLFHNGKLEVRGTHNDLLRQSELYRHLIYVRFTAFRKVL